MKFAPVILLVLGFYAGWIVGESGWPQRVTVARNERDQAYERFNRMHAAFLSMEGANKQNEQTVKGCLETVRTYKQILERR